MSEDPDRKYYTDPQTGMSFEVKNETAFDTWTAAATGLGLIIAAGLWLWLLFDVWSNCNWLARKVIALFGCEAGDSLDSSTYRLVACWMIGGGIGGVINGCRSLIFWHCEKNAFSARFIWKYILFPVLGAVLGLIVYALMHSGVGLLSGPTKPGAGASGQALAYFGVGALAGYGANAVFRWLDYQVSQWFKFKLAESAEVTVPDLAGKTRDEARDILKGLGLRLGKSSSISSDASLINKVVRQRPVANTSVAEDSEVEIDIGKGA